MMDDREFLTRVDSICSLVVHREKHGLSEESIRELHEVYGEARRRAGELEAKRTEADDRGWIGVDLDGTLAQYDGWKGIDHIGEPIAPMVERVKQWLAQGQMVKVFTARVCRDQDGHTVDEIAAYVHAWCIEHIGMPLDVTNVKDFGMIELWDDRAVQVIPNVGLTADELRTAKPVTP